MQTQFSSNFARIRSAISSFFYLSHSLCALLWNGRENFCIHNFVLTFLSGRNLLPCHATLKYKLLLHIYQRRTTATINTKWRLRVPKMNGQKSNCDSKNNFRSFFPLALHIDFKDRLRSDDGFFCTFSTFSSWLNGIHWMWRKKIQMKNNHDNNYDKEKRYKLYAPTPIASVKSRDNYAPRANMSTLIVFRTGYPFW